VQGQFQTIVNLRHTGSNEQHGLMYLAVTLTCCQIRFVFLLLKWLQSARSTLVIGISAF